MLSLRNMTFSIILGWQWTSNPDPWGKGNSLAGAGPQLEAAPQAASSMQHWRWTGGIRGIDRRLKDDLQRSNGIGE